ncbi:hypothetical protein B0H65DRAFT_564713 [Neurospora tetraspora]|uniref:Uncharacterized protein n=1 Tax=Neurospora tetraspora TaxID=94610 RepID=A0AAE0JQV9_9PEZI|nr:hypothetical protein B0H65DRAFT_564713 [Neurospora tetraspora]
MADFPQRNKSFDSMAYRSQAAYNASRRQSNDKHSEPAKSFNTMTYRSQAAYDSARSQSNEKSSEPTKPFNKNVYRSQAAYDASHGESKAQHSEPKKSFNRMAYRSQAAYNASRGRPNKKHSESAKLQQPSVASKTTTSQQYHPAAKRTTTSKEQNPSDDLHVMTDAEVKQWFAEAEADYEAAKKRGEFDNYVPAAGRAPDFSKFRQQFDANGKPAKGLANSRHARKAPEDEEPEKK